MAHPIVGERSGSVNAVIMRGGLVRVKLMHHRSHEARARRSHLTLDLVMQNVAGVSHAAKCVGEAAFNRSARRLDPKAVYRLLRNGQLESAPARMPPMHQTTRPFDLRRLRDAVGRGTVQRRYRCEG